MFRRLIPTSIIDRNGRSTTVHKKQPTQPVKPSTLDSIPPTLGGAAHPSADESWLVKGDLHPGSLCLRIPRIMGSSVLNRSYGNSFRVAGDGVLMSDDEMYRYLRLGIDTTDAAVFKSAGYDPEQIENDPEAGPLLPGHLCRLDDGFKEHILNHDSVLVLMKSAGITGRKAATAIRNGVCQHHFEGALTIEQVVELFMKNSYNRNPRLPARSKSAVVDAITRGDIPLELVPKLKIANLEEAAEELGGYKGEKFLKLKKRSPEQFNSLLFKASKHKMGLLTVDALTRKYNDTVFLLAQPALADAKTGNGDERYGVKNAMYLEAVGRIASKRSDHVDADWQRGNPRNYRQPSGTVTLRGRDLVELRAAGAKPDQAYDLLVVRQMRPEQAVAVARGDTPAALSEGVL